MPGPDRAADGPANETDPGPAAAVSAAPYSAPLVPVELSTHTGLVDDWLADLDRRVSTGQRAAQTRAVYGRAIRPWLHFLACEARTDRPDPTTVERFLASLVASRRAPATINHQLATMCALYRFAERTGRYPHIARAAERLREHRDGPLPCLRHDQIAALRAQADAAVDAAEAELAVAADADRDNGERRRLVALRDRAILGILYGTAVRLVSLHRATIGDWHPELGEFRHRPKGHVAAEAVAFVGDQARGDLDAYLAARGETDPAAPLFASHARSNAGVRLSIRSLSQAALGLFERGGHIVRDAQGRVREPRRLSAHSLRRSAARHIVEHHDLELARQLLGHASLETTRRGYARIQRTDDLRRAAAELDA